MTKMNQINRVAETLFRELISAGNVYQREIIETVSKYKTDMNQVQRTADQRYAVKTRTDSDYSIQRNLDSQRAEEERVMSRYKEDYINEKKSALTAGARDRIRKAQDAFQKTAKETAKSLRNQLEEAILSPINSAFLRLAETLQTFGVAPSRLELDALLTLSEGNLTATRCLDSLLQKTNAPFSLKYRKPEDYVKDLEMIEDLGTDDYFCSPLDLHSEMCEIFRGQKVSRDENSPTFKRNVTFENTEMLIRGRSFDSAMESLEGMVSSWASDINYDATKVVSKEMEEHERKTAENEEREPDLKDYDSSVKVEEDGEGIAIAKELGRQRAMQNKTSLEVLGSMVK